MGPDEGGWTPVAPSPVAYADGWHVPRALDAAELPGIVDAFVAGTRRAEAAGFRAVELHMAHGYLLHEFLSPLANRRDDAYGGDLEGRMRLPLEVAAAVRAAWPAELPLLVRISATDWVEGGWTLDESVVLAERLKALGVDLVDCSSGGLHPDQAIPLGPGYQVPFAAEVRARAGVPTGAVGLITEPEQAQAIVDGGPGRRRAARPGLAARRVLAAAGRPRARARGRLLARAVRAREAPSGLRGGRPHGAVYGWPHHD